MRKNTFAVSGLVTLTKTEQQSTNGGSQALKESIFGLNQPSKFMWLPALPNLNFLPFRFRFF